MQYFKWPLVKSRLYFCQLFRKESINYWLSQMSLSNLHNLQSALDCNGSCIREKKIFRRIVVGPKILEIKGE